MTIDDPELREAFEKWYAVRPKNVARRKQGVVERAEHRLLASLKHDESAAKIAKNAERVRQAQLSLLKATEVALDLPTDIDDEAARRTRENLARVAAAWERMRLDQIVELYMSG